MSRDPDQKEFLQAVEEVFTSLAPVIEKHPEYAAVLERIAEPERQLAFRVPWFDDKGNLQHNRGYRVQMNSALGPYKVRSYLKLSVASHLHDHVRVNMLSHLVTD